MASLKSSRGRYSWIAARKLELCSKNKASVKKAKNPKANREDCSDFDIISVHSKSFSDTANDEDAEYPFALGLCPKIGMGNNGPSV